MKSVFGHCLILLLSRAAASTAEEQDVTTTAPISSPDHPMILRGLKKSKITSTSGCIQIKDGDYSVTVSMDVTGICDCRDVEDALGEIICKEEFSIDTCDADKADPSCDTTLVSISSKDIDKKDASKKLKVGSIEKGLQSALGSQIEIIMNNYEIWKKSKNTSSSGCNQIKDGDYSVTSSVDVTGICDCRDVLLALEQIICKEEFSIDSCVDSGNPSCDTTSVAIRAKDIDKKDASKKLKVGSIEKGLQSALGSQIEIIMNNYEIWKN